MMRLLSKLFPTREPKLDHFPKTIPLKPTPYFFTDNSIIDQKILTINKSFQQHTASSIIAFSFKTNYDFAKSRYLRDNHIWAETVSENEYNLAIKLGFNSSNIILNGPNKTNLLSVLKSKSIIHLDNFAEINQLPNTGITARIGIRLNFSSIGSRFGFNVDNGDALKAIDQLKNKNIKLDSLHIHLGSDNYDPALYQQAATKVAQFINSNHLIPKTIDFGGGYPAHGQTPYGRKSIKTKNITTYINSILTPLDKLAFKPIIIIEPGRYLIDDATVFVAKIINKTVKNDTQVITIDATINMLPSLWYRPPTLKFFNQAFHPIQSQKIKTVVYGCSCQEHDILYQGFNSNGEIGDLIVFYSVGAYNQSMCPEFIFQKPNTYFV